MTFDSTFLQLRVLIYIVSELQYMYKLPNSISGHLTVLWSVAKMFKFMQWSKKENLKFLYLEKQRDPIFSGHSALGITHTGGPPDSQAGPWRGSPPLPTLEGHRLAPSSWETLPQSLPPGFLPPSLCTGQKGLGVRVLSLREKNQRPTICSFITERKTSLKVDNKVFKGSRELPDAAFTPRLTLEWPSLPRIILPGDAPEQTQDNLRPGPILSVPPGPTTQPGALTSTWWILVKPRIVKTILAGGTVHVVGGTASLQIPYPPITSECDFIWKQGLCWYQELVKMRLAVD